MIYLLFRYCLADTRKAYEEFKSKGELIKFIEKKKEEIEIDKIIEVGREFKINWILTLDEISKSQPLGRGRPRKKAGDSKVEEIKPKRGRGRPKKGADSAELKSEEPLEESDEYEEEPVEEAPEEVDEFKEEPEEKEPEESKEEEIETAEKLEKIKKEKKKKLGRCKRKSCLKVFELEPWQHSTLHWCPECRQLPEYKNYDKGRITN